MAFHARGILEVHGKFKQISNQTAIGYVYKQSRDPRTQTLIQQLKIEHEEPLRRAFARSLETIEEHLDSDDASVIRDARRDLTKIIEAGDPPLSRLEVSSDKTKGDFTLAEMLHELRIIRERNPPP